MVEIFEIETATSKNRFTSSAVGFYVLFTSIDLHPNGKWWNYVKNILCFIGK